MDVPGFFIFLYARVLGVVFSRGRIVRSFLRNDLIGTCARRVVFVYAAAAFVFRRIIAKDLQTILDKIFRR